MAILTTGLQTIEPGEQGFQGKHNDNMVLSNDTLNAPLNPGAAKGLITGGAATLADKAVVIYKLAVTKWQYLFFNTSEFTIDNSGTSATIRPKFYSGAGTGSRPSTVGLPVGTTYFDTTTGVPTWWTGANWKTYAGVVVP